MSELRLRGSVTVVTGGSSGIGLATASALLEEGGSVLVVARDPDRLAGTARRLDGPGGRLQTLVLDVCDTSAGSRVLAAVEAAFGRVDGLVNVAGASGLHDLESSDDAEWYRQWELNVMAPKRLMDALAPQMAAGPGGSIVNVCSSAGGRASATNAPYSVTKRAEIALTKVYAERYEGTGVRVNAIAPAPKMTDLWVRPGGRADQAAAAAGLDREEDLASVAAGLPLQRLAAAEEVAAVVLLSLARRTIGAVWGVDGGHVPEVSN
ncbi:MAG TPA: SDR family oxidoreductase [Solirubrobacterales bacterium]|nr:SDR family oxidoreductase [Solirubrobacterales bacterium]